MQVACYRYDPKAFVKKWDSGFVTISNRRVAHGSTTERTVNRALGKSDDKNVMLISGFFPRALDKFAGRTNVIAIDYPGSPSVPVQYVSFQHPAMRDSFLDKLQVFICYACIPSRC
jgi:pimeloyl-ACP methyl ester carboxylesterase